MLKLWQDGGGDGEELVDCGEDGVELSSGEGPGEGCGGVKADAEDSAVGGGAERFVVLGYIEGCEFDIQFSAEGKGRCCRSHDKRENGLD